MKSVTEHYNSKLPGKLGAIAVTFGYHIFYKMSQEEVSNTLRRHEEAHVMQYIRYGFLGFLMLYFYWYLRGRLKGLSHYKAYYEIPFEVEARKAERA